MYGYDALYLSRSLCPTPSKSLNSHGHDHPDGGLGFFTYINIHVCIYPFSLFSVGSGD